MTEQDYKNIYGAGAQGGNTTNAIQKELEAQLRMFGASVTDGVFNGFDGRGEEISARAVGVGKAFADAMEYEVRSALHPDATSNGKNPYDYDIKKAAADSINRATQKASEYRFGDMFRKKPSNALAKAASNRSDIGVLQVVFGALLGLLPLFGGIICGVVGTLLAIVGSAGVAATLFASVVCCVIGIPFSWMFSCGNANLKMAKRMKRYVDVLGEDVKIPVAELAEITGYPLETVKKDIRKIMQQNWCPLWLEERSQTVHLTIASYREAKAAQAEFTPEPKVEPKQTVDFTKEQVLLQSIANFINVLDKQKQIMQEQDAVAELDRMQETCRDIYEWIETHPESAPRLRRFTNYYMPTTLKLLYSYNDVQGQQGENAQTIRQDIGRFLHTLNTAFDNLHDNLISTVSLDVSAEIAALQGMLAQDGLSQQNDFSTAPNLEL